MAVRFAATLRSKNICVFPARLPALSRETKKTKEHVLGPEPLDEGSSRALDFKHAGTGCNAQAGSIRHINEGIAQGK